MTEASRITDAIVEVCTAFYTAGARAGEFPSIEPLVRLIQELRLERDELAKDLDELDAKIERLSQGLATSGASWPD